MGASKAAVRFTASFEANLAAIASFWQDRATPTAFRELLDELETAVGMLERHPQLGRDFLARAPASAEGLDRVAQLRRRLGPGELREYLSGDYLMLYSLDPSSRPAIMHMLAIRHHRQLSFDLAAFWEANRSSGVSR